MFEASWYVGLRAFYFHPNGWPKVGWFSPRRCLAERYVFQVGQPRACCGVVGVAWRSKQSVIVMVFRQHCAVQGRSFEYFFKLTVLPLSSTVVLLFLGLEVILRLTLLQSLAFIMAMLLGAKQRSKLLHCCTLSSAFAFRDKWATTWRQTPTIIVINDTSRQTSSSSIARATW
jgi:hypothetical protein